MDKLHPHSHLFAIRVWEEAIETDQTEWRGKVQLFTSGEVRYFRAWTTLAQLLIEMLSQENSSLNPTMSKSSEEGMDNAITD